MGIPSEEIVVRRIRKKDFAQFFKVLQRAFGREIEIVGLDLQRLFRIVKFYNLIDVLFRILDAMKIHPPAILVAISKREVVGGVHIVPSGNKIWTIDSLVVDPNFRRRGLGALLVSEALKYVWNGRGKKALAYVRADNLPGLKIRKRLRGRLFDERVLMIYRLDEISVHKFQSAFSIREVEPKDAFRIYQLCQTFDCKKMREFQLTSRNFLYSTSERVMSGLGLLFSKKWVLEEKGRVIGYGHVTYTSPKEAAKIETFCLLSSTRMSNLATLLLNKIFSNLQERGIKKVVASLSEESKEMIEIFKSLGFEPIGTFYGVAHELE